MISNLKEMNMSPSKSVSTIIEQKKRGKQVLGCFPLYPPVELFTSMGLLPAVLWNLKTSVQNLTEADKHVQNYACGIARELVQFILSETGELLDGIFSYNACDTLRNIPEILAAANTEAGRDIPMLRMHVPQVNRTQSNPEQYLKNEIECLIDNTEKAFGNTFSSEKFEQTTKVYNKMRGLCRKAESLVSQGILPFGGFCNVVLLNYFLPVEEQINKLTALIAMANNPPTITDKRVIISGIMPPPPPVITAMENSGLRVVANDIASMGRSYAYSPQMTKDPGDFYTDFYANRFPCTTLLYQTDARLTALQCMIERAGARGVIFSGEKFCEYEYFEFPYLEKSLKEMGIPTLLLEFSVDDTENVGAYATRVAAFAEMLDK